MVYIQGNSVPHANHGVLEKLIAARHELSQMMGCNSYADIMVEPNLAKSPKVVTSFLQELSKTVKPKADEEFIAIRDFKREKCGNPSAELEPWDETYYTSMMKSSINDVDTAVSCFCYLFFYCCAAKALRLLYLHFVYLWELFGSFYFCC
jgi:intermediate peptidase